MKSWKSFVLWLCMLAGMLGMFMYGQSDVALVGAEDRKVERFFEMRTYIAHEGKLADLNKRFREHTNRLFVKNGMELVGYWTPVDPEEAKTTLIYILAYPSAEAREASWKAFQSDPEWQEAYKESHKNGPLVKKAESKFLKPTDYSPIK